MLARGQGERSKHSKGIRPVALQRILHEGDRKILWGIGWVLALRRGDAAWAAVIAGFPPPSSGLRGRGREDITCGMANAVNGGLGSRRRPGGSSPSDCRWCRGLFPSGRRHGDWAANQEATGLYWLVAERQIGGPREILLAVSKAFWARNVVAAGVGCHRLRSKIAATNTRVVGRTADQERAGDGHRLRRWRRDIDRPARGRSDWLDLCSDSQRCFRGRPYCP